MFVLSDTAGTRPGSHINISASINATWYSQRPCDLVSRGLTVRSIESSRCLPPDAQGVWRSCVYRAFGGRRHLRSRAKQVFLICCPLKTDRGPQERKCQSIQQCATSLT